MTARARVPKKAPPVKPKRGGKRPNAGRKLGWRAPVTAESLRSATFRIRAVDAQMLELAVEFGMAKSISDAVRQAIAGYWTPKNAEKTEQEQ